ncbi:unnamed protein product [Cuscuta epithymum]|uniref:Uncharacterized protein n=1 Tax=Cuscuta epithymum TaxID=186058 RepID=A0AAV0GJ51_9ASTE|nr:unnamed protein product [Cuscuta epithymum]
MDDLYTSMVELDDKWFDGSAKKSLKFSRVAQHHNCKNQPLLSTEECESDILINPKDSKNFVQGPSEFIISDDLDVKPMSSASSFNILKELRVPITEIEQQVLPISFKEASRFLKATLTSPSAVLTNGLGCFLQKHKT